MTTATLELPWPDWRLSPNARVNRYHLARARKAAKQAAGWECIGESVPRNIGVDRMEASYTFLPPDNRRRDLDNLIASMKSAQDGIAAHVGVDDSRWRTSYEIGEPVNRGKVIVNLRWTA